MGPESLGCFSLRRVDQCVSVFTTLKSPGWLLRNNQCPGSPAIIFNPPEVGPASVFLKAGLVECAARLEDHCSRSVISSLIFPSNVLEGESLSLLKVTGHRGNFHPEVEMESDKEQVGQSERILQEFQYAF